jgi:hypothetical protein
VQAHAPTYTHAFFQIKILQPSVDPRYKKAAVRTLVNLAAFGEWCVDQSVR